MMRASYEAGLILIQFCAPEVQWQRWDIREMALIRIKIKNKTLSLFVYFLIKAEEMCNHKKADLEILNRLMLNHKPKNSRNVNNNPPKHFFMYWKPARLSE